MSEVLLEPVLLGRRVLVVESDDFVAQALKADLEALGATVIGPVASVERASASIAATSELAGAVLNTSLVGESVFPVASDLASRGVPFVFRTGRHRSKVARYFPTIPFFEHPSDVGSIAQELFA